MISRIKPLLKESKIFVLTYNKANKVKKRLHYKTNKFFNYSISESELFQSFKSCGISPGEKIVVNSSLSSIGYIEGGAESFITALKQYITKEGLIVMPSYPHRGMFEYLENYSIFDVNKTPSQNGIITEVFRTSNNVHRSLHPTHPLCFWGKNSKNISEGHENSKSPYDVHSPYKKILDLDIKSFCIGVDFEHMIMIRLIDDLHSNYKGHMYFEDKTYRVPILNKNGQLIEIETKCHDPQKSRQRYNMKLYPFMKEDILHGSLGDAKTILLSSQVMFKHQIRLASQGVYPYHNNNFIFSK